MIENYKTEKSDRQGGLDQRSIFAEWEITENSESKPVESDTLGYVDESSVTLPI